MSWVQEACSQEGATECWVGVKDISAEEGDVGKEFSGAAVFFNGEEGMAVKGKPVSRESWGREKSRNQPIGLGSAAEAKEKRRQQEGKHTPSLVVGLQDAGLHGAGGPLWPPHSIPAQMCFPGLHHDYLKPEKLYRYLDFWFLLNNQKSWTSQAWTWLYTPEPVTVAPMTPRLNPAVSSLPTLLTASPPGGCCHAFIPLPWPTDSGLLSGCRSCAHRRDLEG